MAANLVTQHYCSDVSGTEQPRAYVMRAKALFTDSPPTTTILAAMTEDRPIPI